MKLKINIPTVSVFSLFAIIGQICDSKATVADESMMQEPAQIVIAEWFSIDPLHDMQMQQKLASSSDVADHYQITFTSDDQQTVNGQLHVPNSSEIKNSNQKKLALLLHPMGRDHTIWFNQENQIKGGAITEGLISKGYAVLALDARRHGERKLDDIGLRDLIGRAHSPNRRLYDDMIIGSVRDYRLALNWFNKKWSLEDSSVMVAGYSMGAQMSLLLASYEPIINEVISMVPPYIKEVNSPVAPRHHVNRISSASTLFLAANQDDYSTPENNKHVFDLISTETKQAHYYDSGHVLPTEYLNAVNQFINQLNEEK